jgi:hypothetical protein
MARTIVTVSQTITGALDTTNGNTFVGLGSNGALLDKFPLHLVYVTTGSGNIVVKAGYTPWAPSSSAGDLTIPVSGTNTVTDVGPQIQMSRHLKASSGDQYIDIDYTGGITGSFLWVLGNQQTIPGNLAGAFVAKDLPGSLLGVVVTTLGTAGLSIYDNGATGQGNALLAIAPSAAQGSLYAPTQRAVNGITALQVASGPAATLYFA